ncbi:unnamed protein product, partial [marine sediment metagenome]
MVMDSLLDIIYEPTPCLEPLEPRLLFSAGWDVVLVDTQLAHSSELTRAAD